MTPGLVAHVTVPPPNGFFDHSDGIVGSDHVAGKVGGQHRQIVQMIAGREDVVARNAKLPRNFAERGTFIVGGVAETGINIISHHR